MKRIIFRKDSQTCNEFYGRDYLIDDASTDESLEMAKDILSGFPHHILGLSKPLYHISESLIRRLQWEQTIKHKPQWILQLDADEFLKMVLKKRIKQTFE